MNGERPYLSVVVVARNDDHGGGLRERMQAFINGCIAQFERHRLSAELIVVEWNPPPDRPPLAEALRWPARLEYCAVRIIEVPPAIHARYRHGAALPLYQMIGKNVGIRRAKGRFVLATNIDILFSDELMELLALRQLDPGRMYRMDRYDAMANVPQDGIDEQLAYCRTHLIRLNAREGTFKLTSDGKRAGGERDIVAPDAGILFGDGWFPVEGPRDEPFRWAGESAEIHLAGRGTLALDIEPGPSLNGAPLRLQILNAEALDMGQVTIHAWSRLTIPVPEKEAFRTLILRPLNASSGLTPDPRIRNFRALYCGWEKAGRGRKALTAPAVSGDVTGSSVRKRFRRRWIALQRVIDLLAHSEPIAFVPVTVPRPMRRLLQFYCARGGITGMLTGKRGQAGRGPYAMASNAAPLLLHTNACGDFTLLARDRWFDLRGYPEFDVYSMHLDSVLCCAAHYSGARELVLSEPVRIFHIEHGSGWTPEGETRLFARLTEKGIPFLQYGDLIGWASQMRRLQAPMIFNSGDWGLADVDLRETNPGGNSETADAGA